MPPTDDSTETQQLLSRVEAGDHAAMDQLLSNQRGYLRRLVDLRMDDEMRGRVDSSDVVQETMIVVSKRIDDFLVRRPSSFRLWIRRKAIERLIELRRKHLAGKRTVRREVSLSALSSIAVARRNIAGSPSQAMQQHELAGSVRVAIQALSESDREVLLLRHIEELTNSEVAELLEISPDAASKRYGRAVRRLSQHLAQNGAD